MLNLRRYIAMGILIGLIVLALGLLFGPGIAGWLTGVRDQALRAGFGLIANLIGDPLIWIMLNPVPGALGAAVAWPALLIWLGLFFIMLVLGFGAEAIRQTNEAVTLIRS